MTCGVLLRDGPVLRLVVEPRGPTSLPALQQQYTSRSKFSPSPFRLVVAFSSGWSLVTQIWGWTWARSVSSFSNATSHGSSFRALGWTRRHAVRFRVGHGWLVSWWVADCAYSLVPLFITPFPSQTGCRSGGGP